MSELSKTQIKHSKLLGINFSVTITMCRQGVFHCSLSFGGRSRTVVHLAPSLSPIADTGNFTLYPTSNNPTVAHTLIVHVCNPLMWGSLKRQAKCQDTSGRPLFLLDHPWETRRSSNTVFWARRHAFSSKGCGRLAQALCGSPAPVKDGAGRLRQARVLTLPLSLWSILAWRSILSHTNLSSWASLSLFPFPSADLPKSSFYLTSRCCFSVLFNSLSNLFLSSQL